MAHEIDIGVGKRVRAIRKMRGLSQTELAKATGVKFQQVQKYETGANRISCSRIAFIAKVLDVQISDFFVGIAGVPQESEHGEKTTKGLPDLWFDMKSIAILAAIDSLSDPQREAFLSLLFEISKDIK